MTKLSLDFSEPQLEAALAESSVVRSLVVRHLFPAPPAVSPKEKLVIEVRSRFAPHSSNYIPAIKFVRQYAVDNGISELRGLAEAKAFIDSLGVYRS